MKPFIYCLLLLVAAPALAADEMIQIDCAWATGYLYAMAKKRDNGATEAELVARLPSSFNDKVKLHLAHRIHTIFEDRDNLPSDLVIRSYLTGCMSQHGIIAENRE
jgi:hypothetical protein